MLCTGLCKATGLGGVCPSLCKWMHQLGERMLPSGSAPESMTRGVTLSGWKPVKATKFWSWWPQAAVELLLSL